MWNGRPARRRHLLKCRRFAVRDQLVRDAQEVLHIWNLPDLVSHLLVSTVLQDPVHGEEVVLKRLTTPATATGIQQSSDRHREILEREPRGARTQLPRPTEAVVGIRVRDHDPRPRIIP